jgi:hypothetical protein
MPKNGSSHSMSRLILEGVDEDEAEPTPSVDEGLTEQGALDVGLDDQRV